ncbi:MAG: hypothetical protein GQ534_10760 [Candidatus Delongbacteria bacterium]|nr:hypothetical protein [Candidatus Delongbacteria bacterium]
MRKFMYLKHIVNLLLIFFIFACKNEISKKNIEMNNVYDNKFHSIVYTNYSDSIIYLKKINEINGFIDVDNYYYDMQISTGTIDNRDSILYCYSKNSNSFYKCKINFSNILKPVLVTKKNIGQGPNDINYPFSMVYDKHTNIIYISDLLSRCIYFYNTNFDEIDRIQLEFRPSKLSLYRNKLSVVNYDGALNSGYGGVEINLNNKNLTEIFTLTATLSNTLNIEFDINSVLMLSLLDSNTYFVGNNFSYEIYKVSNENKNIIKAFSTPNLKKGKLPKPKLLEDERGRYIQALVPYRDFSISNNLLFTLSTYGSTKLARDNNLYSFISIYDLNGQYLCEFKLLNPIYKETACLSYDSNNKILYFFNGANIIKYDFMKLKR